MYIILLILVILLFLYSTSTIFDVNRQGTSNEHFTIVAYNNTVIPKYDSDSTYDTQNKKLINLFNKLKSNKNYNADDISSSGQLYNKNLDFPFTETFKKIILDHLIDQQIFNKADKAYIVGGLNNMYIYDI
jgi:hypothetical protein